MFLIYLGISNMKIGLLQSSLFFVIFFTEFPSGVIGDRMGRKNTLLISVFFNILSLLLMIFHYNFITIWISFVFEGISMSFFSGTYSAIFYDSLKLYGKEDKYLKYSGNTSTIVNFLLGISIIVGAFLQNISWEIVYISTLTATLIGGIFLLFVYEKKGDSIIDTSNMKSIDFLKELINFFEKEEANKLWLLIIATSILEAVASYYYIISQSLFDSQKLSIEKIALIYGSLQILTAIMHKISIKINSKFKINKILLTSSILYILLLLLLIFNNSFISLIVLLLVTALSDISYISQDNFIQKMIPSESRSSLLSLFSFTSSVITGLIYIIFGKLGDIFSQNVSFTLLVIPCFGGLFLLNLYFQNINYLSIKE
ncbi:MFS transporter [Haliovirga abyssi]|uniref:MFS transporter n=1 Tax=Haliovirga abyssi TaxID=2996794 RepID=A0AAU9DG33_9FUSO|nr:MFS transporter [Haliovirga abyssi]